MKALCTFKFAKQTKREAVEAAIHSAVFNAECVYGKPRVMVLGAICHLSDDGRHCFIDVSSEVGEHVAQVFTGIIINTLGEDKFRVRRVEGPAIPALAQGKGAGLSPERF